MVSKQIPFKLFNAVIEAARESWDLSVKLSELTHGDISTDFIEGKMEDAALNLLEYVMGDSEGFSDICYFCYELDFGRREGSDTAVDENGTAIDFSSTQKLYEYLCNKINKNKEEKENG